MILVALCHIVRFNNARESKFFVPNPDKNIIFGCVFCLQHQFLIIFDLLYGSISGQFIWRIKGNKTYMNTAWRHLFIIFRGLLKKLVVSFRIKRFPKMVRNQFNWMKSKLYGHSAEINSFDCWHFYMIWSYLQMFLVWSAPKQ